MKIPFIYNLRSVRARYTSSLVAVVAIAGVVAVFISVLAMAKGFQKTLIDSGSPSNAIVLRGGASSEMESVVDLEQSRILSDLPGVAKDPSGAPLMSPEVVVVAAFKLRASGTDANAQVRGVSDKALAIRDNMKLIRGRFFEPGVAELVVGKLATENYIGLDLDSTIRFGGGTWKVVGIMDSGGTAFDSEAWCDARVLNQVYKRPENIYQSVTLKLTSPASLKDFRDAATTDPRLSVDVMREIDYYAKQSQMVSTMIRVLGFMVASVMAIGAIFGAINTMYSAVSARSRELATLRAIGFRERNIIASFLLESLLIAFIGGILGILLVLPLNGNVASTMNWQTFSQMSFAFVISPEILASGLAFALIMGFLGGLFPAYRASRVPVAVALRGL